MKEEDPVESTEDELRRLEKRVRSIWRRIWDTINEKSGIDEDEMFKFDYKIFSFYKELESKKQVKWSSDYRGVLPHTCTPLSHFLDASSHLYKRVCPSVGPSVRPSVRRSVTPFRKRRKTRFRETAISKERS